MAVVRLEILSREPYEGGVAFGESGAYERVDGRLHYAVDPLLPANAVITDLEHGERGVDGRVEFSSACCLLRPVDSARANRNLLYTVPNRGRTGLTFNRPRAAPVPSRRIDPGDGFLLRRGWTLAWSGWQWDVEPGEALLGFEAPEAVEAGRPIQGEVMVQFQPDERQPSRLLADRLHRPYPAADPLEPAARLLVRDWLDGPTAELPRSRWRFARDDHGVATADDTHVWLEGGFEPGRVYQVIYRTRRCPIVGTGLLAVRDAVAFLRYGSADAGNPCAGAFEHTFGTGTSQSARFLRHFLFLGLNSDEEGRQVFDGLLSIVGGAHRGEFNHRYAQPSVQASRGFGQLPPFADEAQADPETGGQQEGLLARQRAYGGVPRVISINTAAEYWPGDASRGDASLLHTDLAGARDIVPPPDARVYYVAGAQHGSGVLPPGRVHSTGVRAAQLLNLVDFSWVSRAALVNLERWVCSGDAPPASALPLLADGTAVPHAQVLTTFLSLPGALVPKTALLPASRRLDLGPEAHRGIGRFPAALGGSFPCFASAVDADANELSGLRLPELAVPVATYTGWNLRPAAAGGAGQLIMMWGSTLPFPATATDRLRTGDPRAAIAERYRDREEYRARALAVAERLAAQGYLLPEDALPAAESATARYDAFAAVPDVVALGDGGG